MIKTNSILGKIHLSLWGIVFVLLFIFCAKIVSVRVYGADNVTKETLVRVGFFEFPGYHEQDENGNRSGFGYEVLKQLRSYTGWEYEYVGYEEGWPLMLDMLESDEIDLLSGIFKTQEKLKRFDFSRHPLGMSSTILTFKEGQTKYKPRDYKNWKSLRVGMIPNSNENDVFHIFSKEHEFYYTPVHFESVTEMGKALQNGEVDAIVSNSLRRFQNEVVFEKLSDRPFYFAVKKGNRELLNELDTALDRLLADKPDILRELFSKYYTTKTVRIVCPVFINDPEEQNQHLTRYILEYMNRVSRINNWNLIVDKAETLANKEFLDSEDIICGIIKNDEYEKVLNFPRQSVARIKTVLLAKENNDAFVKNVPEDWPNKQPIRVGYVPCTLGCTNKLKSFSERYLLNYQPVMYLTEQEMLQALKSDEIDLIVSTEQEEIPEVTVAAICAESDIYFAVPHEKEDIFHELRQTIEYIKIYEQSFLDDLAFQYLDQPKPTNKRVRVCIYEEKLGGYDREYIDRLAEIFNWNVDYINTPYAAAYQYLYEGKVDIVPSSAYTEERAKNYLFSSLDFEVIYYFLATLQENSKMQPNQFSTWNQARIAVLDGSKADSTLAQFLNQYNIRCSFHYYDTLAQAEQSVLDGINNAVYTCTPKGFKPLAVFPTELTYLCINKDKPWLKDEVDRGMAYLRRNEPNFKNQLTEKYFPTLNSDILMLNEEEIQSVKNFNERKIRVDISPEIPPLKTYDPISGEAAGFIKRLLDELSNNTGLRFEYLPPATSQEARRRLLHGESDIWIGFGGDTSPLGETVTGRNSIYLPLVKVFHKNYKDIQSENNKVAVATNDYTLRKFFSDTLAEENILYCPDLNSCYQAVENGKADYTVDSLQSAQYTLWNDYKHSKLIFKSTLSSEYDDPIRFIYSVHLDESVRNIIDKALKSFTQDQIHNYLQSATFTGVKNPILTTTQLMGLISTVIGVSLVVILIFFYRNNMLQKKQLEMQKLTSGCLETLVLKDQDFEEAIKAIVTMLVRHFNAKMGWFAQYEEDGIFLETMVGFDIEIDPSCLKTIPREKYEQWKAAQEKNRIYLQHNSHRSRPLGIEEWDNYISRRNIKTICNVSIKMNDTFCGNIALCFDRMRHVLSSEELHILKYFQHVMEAALTRKEMIRNLTTERDRAVQAEKAKSFFFACVSHDIRTPLNAIIGFSDLLKFGDVEPEMMDSYLENISFSSNVLMDLVNNILDLSKLDAKSMVYVYDFCNFRELGSKVIKVFSHRAADENLELKMEFQPRMPALKLDSQHVHQILFNLVGNAVKFTKQGSITLKAACQPAKDDPSKMDLEFSVCDTGIGIDKKHFKNIFKPFQQIQNMTQTGGTGLGLSICTIMVEQMGGTIDVESEVGKGSVFTVKLKNLEWRPLRPEEEEIEAEEIKANDTPGAVSLLLVDDVMMNLQVLEALCKKAGVTDIVKAQSGDEALEILKKRRFSAVLTDMWMPGMNGAELAKHVREKFDALPIYLITADVEFLKRYQEEGFTGCLTKPVTLEKLQEILSKSKTAIRNPKVI